MKLIFYFYIGLGNSVWTTNQNNKMGQFALAIVASDGSANSTTIYLDTQFVSGTGTPTESELVSFPTAQSAVSYRALEQTTNRVRRYLSSSTPAAVTSAINASNAGVLGSGASGQTTLVAGTKVIAIPGLTTSNLAFVSLVSSLTGSSTVTYQAVCTANTLTLRANVAAGTINTADVSIVNYAILG